MEDMISYTEAAMERAMKVEEVILRAIARKITWWQAAEIIGISDRQMRRWHQRYEEFGIRGLYDRRRGKPSPKRVALAEVEKVLHLYGEKYFDLNYEQEQKPKNRTFHLLQKADILTCYEQPPTCTGQWHMIRNFLLGPENINTLGPVLYPSKVSDAPPGQIRRLL